MQLENYITWWSSLKAFFWSIDFGLLQRPQLVFYQIGFECPVLLNLCNWCTSTGHVWSHFITACCVGWISSFLIWPHLAGCVIVNTGDSLVALQYSVQSRKGHGHSPDIIPPPSDVGKLHHSSHIQQEFAQDSSTTNTTPGTCVRVT